MPRGDLLDQGRFTLEEPSLLLRGVVGCALVPPGDAFGGGDVGGQMLAVGLSAEHEQPLGFP